MGNGFSRRGRSSSGTACVETLTCSPGPPTARPYENVDSSEGRRAQVRTGPSIQLTVSKQLNKLIVIKITACIISGHVHGNSKR